MCGQCSSWKGSKPLPSAARTTRAHSISAALVSTTPHRSYAAPSGDRDGTLRDLEQPPIIAHVAHAQNDKSPLSVFPTDWNSFPTLRVGFILVKGFGRSRALEQSKSRGLFAAFHDTLHRPNRRLWKRNRVASFTNESRPVRWWQVPLRGALPQLHPPSRRRRQLKLFTTASLESEKK